MSPPRSSRSKAHAVAVAPPPSRRARSGTRDEPAGDSGTFDFMSQVPSPIVATPGATTPTTTPGSAGQGAPPTPAATSMPAPAPAASPAIREPDRLSADAMPVSQCLCTLFTLLTIGFLLQPPQDIPRKAPPSLGNFMDNIPLSQRLYPADPDTPGAVCIRTIHFMLSYIIM